MRMDSKRQAQSRSPAEIGATSAWPEVLRGMLAIATAVPGAFGDDAVLFGVAYRLARLLRLVFFAIVGHDDPDRLGALLRFAPASTSAFLELSRHVLSPPPLAAAA
jgi:hypothetical protein